MTLAVEGTCKREVVVIVAVGTVIGVWRGTVRTDRLEVGAAHGDVGIHFIVCLTIAYPAVGSVIVGAGTVYALFIVVYTAYIYTLLTHVTRLLDMLGEQTEVILAT